MARGHDPCKVVEKVGENAHQMELPRDIHISAPFNVGDLTPYIEDKDEYKKDLRENPLWGWGEVDMEQTTSFDILLQAKALIQVGTMTTLGNRAQQLHPRWSLLSWGP